MLTQTPTSSMPSLDIDAYRIQKIALEETVKQLRNRHLGIKFTIVRPGNIATSPDKTVPPAADVNNWAGTLLDIFNLAKNNNLEIPEISLGPVYK